MTTGFSQSLLDSQSDSIRRTGVSGSRTVFYSRSYLHKPRNCVIEELLITLTEIIFHAVLSIQTGSVFHTSAATDIKVSTDKTLVTKIFLATGKGPFFTAGSELLQRRLKNVA
jgi:hypothetical protein